MDLTDLHPPDDYSHRFFIWHEWIQVRSRISISVASSHAAGRPTALLQPRMCSNTLRRLCSTTSRATTKFYACKPCTQACPSLTRQKNLSECIVLLLRDAHSCCYRRFTGVEFALVHSQPPSLFIIQKRDRLSPDEGVSQQQSLRGPKKR